MTTNSINNTSSSLTVSNLNLTASTVATLSTNSNLILAPNGTGTMSINSVYTLPTADGSANQLLQTNGTGAVSFVTSQSFSSIVTQTFTSSGTYTPTSGMVYCIIEVCGAGGGGGGAPATGSGQTSVGCPGSGGGYAVGIYDAATIGASQTVTIGAGGTAGNSTTPGGTGGTTSVGSLLTGFGGSGGNVNGGLSVAATATASTEINAPPGTGVGGYLQINGQWPSFPFAYTSGGSSFGTNGIGGLSYLGKKATLNFQGNERSTAQGSDGSTPTDYGVGGGGSFNLSNQGTTRTGGAGAPGVVIVTEYIR